MSDDADSLYGAVNSSVGLAGILERLTQRVPAEPAKAAAALRIARAVSRVHGPAIVTRRDLGAVAAQLMRGVRMFARAADPALVAPDLYDAARQAVAFEPIRLSPTLQRRARPTRCMGAGFELICLIEAMLADGRANVSDPAGAAIARARIAAAHDAAADRIGSLLGRVASQALARSARDMARHIADQASSLKPLVRVDVARSNPSTALAWRLYGDPARGAELVARAAGGTPMFMPTSFIAVNPGV